MQERFDNSCESYRQLMGSLYQAKAFQDLQKGLVATYLRHLKTVKETQHHDKSISKELLIVLMR